MVYALIWSSSALSDPGRAEPACEDAERVAVEAAPNDDEVAVGVDADGGVGLVSGSEGVDQELAAYGGRGLCACRVGGEDEESGTEYRGKSLCA